MYLNVINNKVTLDRVRQHLILEDISKHLKPYNDRSMCDYGILEEFTHHSLDTRLNEVNNMRAGKGFKSNKSILKKVGKYFRTLLHNYKFDYFYWQFYFQIKLKTISRSKCIVRH